MPPQKRHREDYPLPLRGRWVRYFIGGMLLLTSPVWLCIGPLALWGELTSNERNPATLRVLFNLPDEAQIVSGGYKHHFPMGGHGYIRFTLPNDHTPEQWIAVIAKAAFGKHAKQTRVSAIEYDGYNGEGYRVKYLEIDAKGRHIYEAESAWD